MTKRCGWVKMNNPLYVAYHDEEWGKPLHDDRALFELLCLETYQSGLSWETVLNKRHAFREAFHFYDAQKIAQMTDADLDDLLDNPDIIRNKLKIYATRDNAQAFLAVQKQFGSFNDYIWSFVDFKTIDNEILDYKEAPAKTELSETMSKAMKKQGFKFVGPVCVYSFLEAAGLINDHENDCDWNQNDENNKISAYFYFSIYHLFLGRGLQFIGQQWLNYPVHLLIIYEQMKTQKFQTSRFFVILFISLLSFLHPNLFLDKDAQFIEEHKEGGDEEASHKDMVQVSKDTNINQDGKKVEDD